MLTRAEVIASLEDQARDRDSLAGEELRLEELRQLEGRRTGRWEVSFPGG